VPRRFDIFAWYIREIRGEGGGNKQTNSKKRTQREPKNRITKTTEEDRGKKGRQGNQEGSKTDSH
jgi:hypothetical protein